MNRQVHVTGWGKCVPPAVLTNSDLEQRMDTSDEWITTRSGIKERRIADCSTTDMAEVAARHALAAAGLNGADLDFIVVATCSPDRLMPSVSASLQDRIGATQVAAVDVNAACTGFVYAMGMASSLVTSGQASKVLVVGADKLSHWLDYNDRGTAVLFGDGAGAVVLEHNPSPDESLPTGVLASTLGANGAYGSQLTVAGSGTEHDRPISGKVAISMDGREVFRQAVTVMGDVSAQVVADAGLELPEIDLLIPHQANSRIIDAIARRLDLDPDRVFVNIHGYGNTSAASIPIALVEALEEGRIEPGANLLLVAFGAGFTWGAMVLRWGDRVDPLGTSDARLPDTGRTGLQIMDAKQVTA